MIYLVLMLAGLVFVGLMTYFTREKHSGFIDLDEGHGIIFLCSACAYLGNKARPFESKPKKHNDLDIVRCFACGLTNQRGG